MAITRGTRNTTRQEHTSRMLKPCWSKRGIVQFVEVAWGVGENEMNDELITLQASDLLTGIFSRENATTLPYQQPRYSL